MRSDRAWGIGVFVIYAAAIGAMLYMYYRDSKQFNKLLESTRFSLNGKSDEQSSRAVVEDYRNDRAESATDGL